MTIRDLIKNKIEIKSTSAYTSYTWIVDNKRFILYHMKILHFIKKFGEYEIFVTTSSGKKIIGKRLKVRKKLK